MHGGEAGGHVSRKMSGRLVEAAIYVFGAFLAIGCYLGGGVSNGRLVPKESSRSKLPQGKG